MSDVRHLPGWEDFEPEGDREEMAYALMVAGECIDIPGTDGCRLDYELADAILEALEHRGLGLAPQTKHDVAGREAGSRLVDREDRDA